MSKPSNRRVLRHIKPFGTKLKRSAMVAAHANELVHALNALLSMKIVRGDKDEVFISDSNCVIQFRSQTENPASPITIERYRLKTESSDYLGCVAWDGITEGGVTVLVAKPPKLRRSLLTETIEGVQYDYTYVAGPDSLNVYRVAKIHGSTEEFERCLVTPEWLPNDEIYAVTCDTGVAGVDRMLINCDARAWAFHV